MFNNLSSPLLIWHTGLQSPEEIYAPHSNVLFSKHIFELMFCLVISSLNYTIQVYICNWEDRRQNQS